jgi:hypothetical protein
MGDDQELHVRPYACSCCCHLSGWLLPWSLRELPSQLPLLSPLLLHPPSPAAPASRPGAAPWLRHGQQTARACRTAGQQALPVK